jgi:hypothetical protein
MPTLYVLSATPICHSLKVLKIPYGPIQVPIEMQVSSTAFLLRHFPQMDIVGVNFMARIPCYGIYIQLLDPTGQVLKVLHDCEMPRQIGSRGELRRPKWISHFPSQGNDIF